VKRVFDLLLSIFGIIITLPLFIIIAIGIKLTSIGPIIFSQSRVGRGEKIFKVYKFRTMISQADKIGTSVTTSKDTRITRFGRFLRLTKLDELPQLWNVLKGDMSFVGPRPDVPEIVETYAPEMKNIFKIKPGITSVASLYLRDEEALLCLASNPDLAYEKVVVPEKVKLAMQHVEKNSFWFDLKILFKTIWAVAFGKIFFRNRENNFYKSLREKIFQFNKVDI